MMDSCSTATAPQLESACEAFLADSAAVYGDAGAATRDSDRLEALAGRLVLSLDALEPAFDRLEVARDGVSWIGVHGRRRQRTRWNREDLVVLMAEGFADLLSPPALATLVAACRREASR